MSNTVKILVYLALITATVIFAGKARHHYLAEDPPAVGVAPAPAPVPDPVPDPELDPDPEELPEPAVAPAPERAATPAAGLTESVASKPSGKKLGAMLTYGGLALLSLGGLALMVSRDLSRFMAHRAERFLFSDDGEGMRDPEYERAEQVWVNGQFLEAIQMMREFLKRNPRALHVALRIAEIYEKDLGNHLAAALEYEEVLKLKLPAERWGWAAIHLANLYSGKLGRPEQALELLRRIVSEYGQTAAAKKARARLSTEDPAFSESSNAEVSDSNLPPGFSPRER